jgi:hypothetical protein
MTHPILSHPLQFHRFRRISFAFLLLLPLTSLGSNQNQAGEKIQNQRVKAIQQRDREYESDRPAPAPDKDGSKPIQARNSDSKPSKAEVMEKEKKQTDKDDQGTPAGGDKKMPRERVVKAEESDLYLGPKNANGAKQDSKSKASSKAPAAPSGEGALPSGLTPSSTPDSGKSTATPGFGGPSIEFPKK